MKNIKLLTYTLTPLLATQTQPYLHLLHSRTSDGNQFQTFINSQEYLEKYQEVQRSGNTLDDNVQDGLEYNGYNISSTIFGKFYDNFKIFLGHSSELFIKVNTDKYVILQIYEEKLDRLYNGHRKNSIKKLENHLNGRELIKLSKILFNNLTDIGKNTQHFYTDLKNISYEQFV